MKVEEILSIVAGILKLGNIQIDGDEDTSDIKDMSQLQLAADMFKVDPADLAQAITKETVPLPGDHRFSFIFPRNHPL